MKRSWWQRLGGLVVAAAVLLVGAGTALATPASSGGAVRPPGSVMRFWAPEFMTRHPVWTAAQAVADAKAYDVIVAHDSSYGPYVAAMKKANPNVRVYLYMNATFAQASEGTAFPDSWYLKTSDGRKIRAFLWGNYLMDAGNPAWVANRASACLAKLATTHYDGCTLDMVTVVAISKNYVDGVPVNPRTGATYAVSDWFGDLQTLVHDVKAATARPITINGVGDGPSYFDPQVPSKAYLVQVDGAIAEVFLRVGRATLDKGPTEEKWRQNVDMLVDAEASGRQVLASTKTWNVGTQAQKDQWHRFGLASFLLGASGRSRYYFTYTDPADQTAFHPWWTHDPGAPTGAYFKAAEGYYERTFAGGIVVANPTDAAITVNLPRPMRTLAGALVTQVTLTKWDGEVLVG